ncbi:MAG: pyridoxamine 5'-phosphate oxidase family protein [Candidatus Binatia bacterium]
MIDSVEEYVGKRQSMVLATHVNGEVRASTTCFAPGEHMTIYFLVFQNSVKHRGLLENRQVSLVIDDGFAIPMRGVEIIGSADVVTGAERRRGQELLTRRFPDLIDVWNDSRILIVRVTPSRVRYTDWTKGLGQSREASILSPAAGS